MNTRITRKLQEIIEENPVFSGITVISSVSAAIHQYTSVLKHFRFSMAVIDFLILIALLVSTYYLLSLLIKSFYHRKRQISYKLQADEKPGILQGLRKSWAIITLLMVTMSFSFVFISKLSTLFSDSGWKVCGIFDSSCSDDKDCVLLLDKWKRPISFNCIKLDAAKYCPLQKGKWYSYKPYYISLYCKETRLKQYKLKPIHFKPLECANEPPSHLINPDL